MQPTSAEQILALAGDPRVAATAPEVAVPSRWSGLGVDGDLVWGSCQGSASTPYRTAAVLSEPPAFTCSCPSRSFPCRHALALLMLHASGAVTAGDPPGFAADLAARHRSAAGRQRRTGPVDPDAAARRARDRSERVAAGLAELDRWLMDQVRGGLAGLERSGYSEIDAMAARMVDAQAPGVAGLLRALPAELARPEWPQRVLDRFAALHLLVQAHRRLDRLPDGLAATVRARIGYPVSKAEVLDRPGVVDHWRAVGSLDSVEYRLESRRVWLLGEQTGQWALLLSFAPPGGQLDTSVQAGHRLHARLHFYPGSGQYRALLGEQRSVTSDPVRPEPETLAATRGRFARLLAEDPWAPRMPALVAVTPVRDATRAWRFRDPDGACCALVGTRGAPWPVLARAAARPALVFGEWSGEGLRPLALPAEDDRGLPFSASVSVEAA